MFKKGITIISKNQSTYFLYLSLFLNNLVPIIVMENRPVYFFIEKLILSNQVNRSKYLFSFIFPSNYFLIFCSPACKTKIHKNNALTKICLKIHRLGVRKEIYFMFLTMSKLIIQ